MFVLPLLAQKSWGKWTAYGNVGFWWRNAPESHNYFYAGAVLEREINDKLELGVELFGNSPKERGIRSELAFNIGATWKMREHLNLLFSAGRDIVGDTHAMAFIGLQLLTK